MEDGLSVLIMLILLMCSAYFSATETAFTSLSSIRIKNMADLGNKKAKRVLHLVEQYDKLLSAILIGNNIVNIAATSIATVFFIKLVGNEAGPTVSTVVITIAVLIIGEITPKNLAKQSPEKFAMFSSGGIGVLMWLLTPVIFMLSLWNKLTSKLIKSEKNSYTDSELLTIVDVAEQEGGIDEQESEIVKSAIVFNEAHVDEIITPRVDVTGVPEEATYEEVKQIFKENGFSRLPVYRETLDDIIGILHEKDFYESELGDAFAVSKLMKKPLFVNDKMKVGDLLMLLKKSKSHMTVVTDEYGGTLGIVTMEDILEELVGDIWDEHDEVIEEFVKLEERTYKIVCSASADEMFELFDLEADTESVTVSGWVTEQLSKIPEEGDTFKYENLNVKVTNTDSKRVLEIVVTVDEEEIDKEDE